jgi:hypothetical protein
MATPAANALRAHPNTPRAPKPSDDDSNWPEKVFAGLMGAIFVIGLLGVYTDYFTLRYIPLNIKNSNRIGTTTKVQGNSRRRLALDPLWLYLRKGALYDGDMVFTDLDGKVELEIDDEGDKLEIQPRSLVRIGIFEGKFLIELRRGEIKADLASSKQVVIQDGREMKEVSLPKGESTIKQEDELQVELPDTKKEEKPKENRVAEVQALDQWDLPAPADRTVFLVQKEAPILVSPKARSVGRGKLTIRIPKKDSQSVSFGDGEQPVFWLDVPADMRGSLEWTFKDLQGITKGTFSIENFSEAGQLEPSIGPYMSERIKRMTTRRFCD